MRRSFDAARSCGRTPSGGELEGHAQATPALTGFVRIVCDVNGGGGRLGSLWKLELERVIAEARPPRPGLLARTRRASLACVPGGAQKVHSTECECSSTSTSLGFELRAPRSIGLPARWTVGPSCSSRASSSSLASSAVAVSCSPSMRRPARCLSSYARQGGQSRGEGHCQRLSLLERHPCAQAAQSLAAYALVLDRQAGSADP